MSGQGQPVEVTDLDLPQLADVKRQLDEELSHLTNSFAQLKQAQAKFRSSIESVESIKSSNKDRTVLVPLTGSLYVPGKITDFENVVVDIGTGYFVEKTTADAKSLFTNKVNFVKEKLDTLQETIERKQDNLRVVIEVMQVKMAEQQAAGAQAAR